MKTDLEILIEHYQQEVNYLKSSMDACIEEWDFDGAKAFKAPLIFSSSKLNTLKSIQNPNFKKISRLTGSISSMEEKLKKGNSTYSFPDKETGKKMEEYFLKTVQRKLERYKTELEIEKSKIQSQRSDNDKILELLEEIDPSQSALLTFEIIENEVFLYLSIESEKAVFQFSNEIQHYLISQTSNVLANLGFDLKTYSKTIANYHLLDKVKILEEISIIIFEVFQLFGNKEINVIIEKDPPGIKS